MDVHLLYSSSDTLPEEEDDEYLIISDCETNDDDHQVESLGQDTELADKSTYRETFGFKKMLEIYLNPEQVEDNKIFLDKFLNAHRIWVWVPGGWYQNDDNEPVLSAIDFGVRKVKFLDLLQNPLTFKSCGVFQE